VLSDERHGQPALDNSDRRGETDQPRADDDYFGAQLMCLF
jgi:hypothetical protein